MVVRFTTTYATTTHICSNCALILWTNICSNRGRRNRGRMVVRFTTTYATITYICSNCALSLWTNTLRYPSLITPSIAPPPKKKVNKIQTPAKAGCETMCPKRVRINYLPFSFTMQIKYEVKVV
jgi:hypothetical protein